MDLLKVMLTTPACFLLVEILPHRLPGVCRCVRFYVIEPRDEYPMEGPEDYLSTVRTSTSIYPLFIFSANR